MVGVKLKRPSASYVSVEVAGPIAVTPIVKSAKTVGKSSLAIAIREFQSWSNLITWKLKEMKLFSKR